MQTPAIRQRSISQWEDSFLFWSQPPSKTEKIKCENTVKQIKIALSNHTGLSHRPIDTFVQGSYANRLNVRQDSDVDVCCLHPKIFFYTIPPGYQPADFDLGPASTYTYKQYNNDVFDALTIKFGINQVKRGKKAIDVNETSNRVDADVIAGFEYREYKMSRFGPEYVIGTGLIADNGNRLITNFPKQQYDNGVEKNKSTSMRYKKIVRIQKVLLNKIIADKRSTLPAISSFILEGLCWSAPNYCFEHDTLFEDFYHVTDWAIQQTSSELEANLISESNGIKSLFGDHNPVKPPHVRSYLQKLLEITLG